MTPKDGHKTHRFPGGHNKDYLAKTFSVTLEKISNADVKLTVAAKRLGHAFPTGDLFRTMVIKLLDKKKQEIKRITLSAKRLRERNIITPPVAREDAYYIKNISLSNSDLNRIDSYELSMNYINESNKLFSKVEDNTSKLVFKREKIGIQQR